MNTDTVSSVGNAPAKNSGKIPAITTKRLAISLGIAVVLVTTFFMNQTLADTEYNITVYGTAFSTEDDLQAKLNDKAKKMCGNGNFVIEQHGGEESSALGSVKMEALSAKVICKS